MREFKSVEDLSKLNPNNPAYPIVKDLVKRLIINYIAEGYDYKPQDDGWIVLIEEQDQDRILTEIWPDWKLLDIPWEGISMVGGFFQAVFLANDQFGLVFLIPNAPWLSNDLRRMIDDHLDPLPDESLSLNPKENTHEEI